ncbi:ABC transporter ATP-binding protein [Herbaspirillum lusitanum]|uniref:ABC transporter ATP-binding protein n=1 Tax=Herbaspirillum lusitanum TaxID=213312 RepID=UPI00223875F9|nr:ABC transporter ATP-binding protein [Herbaspirillum lusitanum]MCW5299462.1 ABC transporter ATP-binding protein [Herbaspirillum lusitanum]
MTATSPARLQIAHIRKTYPGVLANDDINLSVAPGEIHAVLGENGAGKSTLMKIIFGTVKPDAGEIYWNGALAHIANPQIARKLGIAMVFQHFSLFDTLTVAENIALGLDADTDMQDLVARIRQTGEKYGLELEPNRHVHTLSVGERQRVEIVRALLTNPQLLILDEPTSVLTPQAVEKLFVTLRLLADEGCSILYISHKLDEIRALCHSATVMRGGRVTGTCDPRNETSAGLSRMMIGEELVRLRRERNPESQRNERKLHVNRLCLPKAHLFATELKDIECEVRAGEIVGIAGVSGNGQQELLAALSGEDQRAAPNMIMLGGSAVGHLAPNPRRAKGLGLVPEERLGRGAVPTLSLSANMLLSHQKVPYVKHGMIDFAYTRKVAAAIIERFKVKAGGPDALAKSLSGGNLQKFIVGREMERKPGVFIVAQPTWGVDVGAAAQIHAEILALKQEGCAVLVISEELDELFALCDRLHVIAKGRLSPSIPIEQATREQVGLWMSGLWNDDASDAAAEAAHG